MQDTSIPSLVPTLVRDTAPPAQSRQQLPKRQLQQQQQHLVTMAITPKLMVAMAATPMAQHRVVMVPAIRAVLTLAQALLLVPMVLRGLIVVTTIRVVTMETVLVTELRQHPVQLHRYLICFHGIIKFKTEWATSWDHFFAIYEQQRRRSDCAHLCFSQLR